MEIKRKGKGKEELMRRWKEQRWRKGRMGSAGRRGVVRGNRGEEPEDKRTGRMWK